MRVRLHPIWALVIGFCFFAIVLLAGPFIGPTPISYEKVFSNAIPFAQNQDAQIFFSVRLPRHLMAALAGGAMALSGVVFQAVLRNPLACPFTLGVAGGSSFGAVLAVLLGLSASWGGFSWMTLFAFLGALGSLLLVFALAFFLRSFSATTLLLAGVAISYFFNALVLLSYYLADFTQTYAMIHWLIGSVEVTDMTTVERLAVILFLAGMVVFGLARELNLLSAGEELARSKGVAASRVIFGSILLASLLTSVVVAQTGPIAFVGLIIPHICRLWIGNDHRYLIPASAMGGATFLMLCDTVARSFFKPMEVPVGVFTALLGVPVLLWFLFREKGYLRH